MSSLDLLREFAESREHDAVLIRDGVSYGEIREVLRVIAELEAELAAERARREADETDAARYRWLREWRARWEIRYWNGIYWNQLITDELGAAIDAAIAAERGGK